MIVVYFLQALIATIGPFALGWWFVRRFRVSWLTYLAGSATFILSQVVHIPMVVAFRYAYPKGHEQVIFYAIALGLMAGLCEEICRHIMYKYVVDGRRWGTALVAGLGHGGIECTLLVGVGVFAALLQMISLKKGDYSMLKGMGDVPLPYIQEKLQAFWSGSLWGPIAALVERASAMTFHTAMSVMVLQGIRKKNLLYLISAIFCHTALDFCAVYLSAQKYSLFTIEMAGVFIALLSLLYILHGRKEQEVPYTPPPETVPKPGDDVIIKVEGLTRRFGDFTAVDKISFEVRRGEIFGFLGPNGAGKTTTVRMLSGLIESSGGEAWVNGFRLGKDDDEIRASGGILTETPGLYPRLSAYKNLEYFARLYGVKNADEQVEKYLKLLGLWDRRDSLAGDFSKGMRQKLAIGRALINEPPVVFLDEPTGSLDPESASVVRDFILDVRAQGRTVFLCTHNLDEADRLCDRIAIMKKTVIELDTPQGLRQRLFGQRVRLRLRRGEGEPSDATIQEKLSALEFVRSVELEGGAFSLDVQSPDDNNHELIQVLARAGAHIQYVEEVSHSLEEIYFALIEEDKND